MIGHQAVSMHVALKLEAQLPEVGEVQEVVALLFEAGGAVVPSLDDVNSHAGQDQPPLSRHWQRTARRGGELTEPNEIGV